MRSASLPLTALLVQLPSAPASLALAELCYGLNQLDFHFEKGAASWRIGQMNTPPLVDKCWVYVHVKAEFSLEFSGSREMATL